MFDQAVYSVFCKDKEQKTEDLPQKVAKEVGEEEDIEGSRRSIKFTTVSKNSPCTGNDLVLVRYDVHLEPPEDKRKGDKEADHDHEEWYKVVGVLNISTRTETIRKDESRNMDNAISHAPPPRLPPYSSNHAEATPRQSPRPASSRAENACKGAAARTPSCGRKSKTACPRCKRWCKYETKAPSVNITCPSCHKRFESPRASPVPVEVVPASPFWIKQKRRIPRPILV